MAEKWSKAPKLALWAGENEGDGRTYVDPFTDERLPSITTVLKQADKSDLMGWAALMVAKAAVERYADLGRDPDQVMKWLPYAHNEYRDERAWVGSGVHATVEAEHKDTWDFPDLDDEQQAMMNQWYAFCKTYNVRIIHSEFTVLVPNVCMGTGDFIFEFTDPITGEVKIALGDLKTSKRIWDEHYAQLAALSAGEFMFQEVPEGTEGAALRKGKTKKDNSWWLKLPAAKFDVLAVVHLRADFYDFIEVPEEEVETHLGIFLSYANTRALKERLKGIRSGK